MGLQNSRKSDWGRGDTLHLWGSKMEIRSAENGFNEWDNLHLWGSKMEIRSAENGFNEWDNLHLWGSKTICVLGGEWSHVMRSLCNAAALKRKVRSAENGRTWDVNGEGGGGN